MLDPMLVELAKTQRLLRALLADAAGGDALGPSHTAVLVALGSRGRSTGAELARAASITPQAMNEVVRRLEHAGEVRRIPHPVDKRKIEYDLTPIGRARIAESDAAVHRTEERIAGAWDAERQAALLDELRAANTSLEALLKPPETD